MSVEIGLDAHALLFMVRGRMSLWETVIRRIIVACKYLS